MKFVCTYSDGKAGVIQELATYLAERRESFWYLEHPLFPGTERTSRLDWYECGTLRSSQALGEPARNSVLHHLQAVWITFVAVFSLRRKISLFTGASNVDCLVAGLALPRQSTRIVFVSIDYSPRRFSNPLLEGIFRVADRFCYRMASAVWHSYPDATKLKPYALAVKEKCFETLHGNNCRRIERKPFSERNRFGLVYLGTVTPFAHLEAVLAAIQTLKPRFPAISLDVIGEAADPACMRSLKQLASSLGVSDRVTWHGLIAEPPVFERIMTGLGVALCLYEMTPERYSWYQLPGKVFAYAACGLPTIVLDKCGPVGTRETEANHIGVVTSLDGLTGAISALLENPNLHESLCDSSAKWAAHYDWHAKFEKHLGKTLDLRP